MKSNHFNLCNMTMKLTQKITTRLHICMCECVHVCIETIDALSLNTTIYIYIYGCVCVCVRRLKYCITHKGSSDCKQSEQRIYQSKQQKYLKKQQTFHETDMSLEDILSYLCYITSFVTRWCMNLLYTR